MDDKYECKEDAITASLDNVREPKLSKTLIKLREVYHEVNAEAERGSEDLCVARNNDLVDKFNDLYVSMQICVVKILANNLTAEIVYSKY